MSPAPVIDLRSVGQHVPIAALAILHDNSIATGDVASCNPQTRGSLSTSCKDMLCFALLAVNRAHYPETLGGRSRIKSAQNHQTCGNRFHNGIGRDPHCC